MSKIKLTHQADYQQVNKSTLIDSKTKKVSVDWKRAQGCAIAAQSILNTFASLISKMADCQFADRLSVIMKKIGFRKSPRELLISGKRDYLYLLRFNTAVDFDKVVKIEYATIHIPSRNAATLSVPACNPLNSINGPAGATHFRLINALGVIADFKLNITAGTYEPIDAVNHEKSIVGYSSYLPISSFLEAQTLEITLPYYPGLAENNSVIQCIGIEFYQQAGGEFYPFFSGNCLKVVDVF